MHRLGAQFLVQPSARCAHVHNLRTRAYCPPPRRLPRPARVHSHLLAARPAVAVSDENLGGAASAPKWRAAERLRVEGISDGCCSSMPRCVACQAGLESGRKWQKAKMKGRGWGNADGRTTGPLVVTASIFASGVIIEAEPVEPSSDAPPFRVWVSKLFGARVAHALKRGVLHRRRGFRRAVARHRR